MLESKLERDCCKYAKTLGIANKKLTHDKGDADRIFLYKGCVLFIEFKASGKKARPIQEYNHLELKRAGFNVLVIDDPTVFKIVITKWIKQCEVN